MFADKLKKAFDPYFNAPIEAWIEFANFCQVVQFDKNEVIKDQYKTEKYFYFILSGSTGIFLWKDNNFVCLDFAFENNFCADYMSFLTNEPTPLILIALEKTKLLKINRNNFYQLAKTPIGQIIVQTSAESSFIEKQQQQIELLTKSAEERYQLLVQKHPKINNIAQKHIASYLGITPQSLSRIKRNIKIVTK